MLIIEELRIPDEVLTGERFYLTAFPILLEGCGGSWTRAAAGIASGHGPDDASAAAVLIVQPPGRLAAEALGPDAPGSRMTWMIGLLPGGKALITVSERPLRAWIRRAVQRRVDAALTVRGRGGGASANVSAVTGSSRSGVSITLGMVMAEILLASAPTGIGGERSTATGPSTRPLVAPDHRCAR